MNPEEAKKKQLEEINQILFKDIKQFVDSTRLYFADDFFALRLNVGSQGFTYVLTPYLAKALARVFKEQVENYEKNIRTISNGAPSVSPVQMSDLQKPDDPENNLNDKK